MALTKPGNPPITSSNRSAYDHKVWLEALVDQVELLQWFIGELISEGVTAWWKAGHAAPSVTGLDTTVTVAAGAGFYANVPFRKYSSSGVEILATVTHPRIDKVCWDAQNENLVAVQGTAAASPAAPAVPTNYVEIAEVYVRVGSTTIKAADDSTNSYMTDTRDFV